MRTRFCPNCKTETAYYIGMKYGEPTYECINCNKQYIRRKKERQPHALAAK